MIASKNACMKGIFLSCRRFHLLAQARLLFSRIRTTSAIRSFCTAAANVFRDTSICRHLSRSQGICNQARSSWNHSDLKDPAIRPQPPVWLPVFFFSLLHLFLLNSALRDPLLRRRKQPPAVQISILHPYCSIPPFFRVPFFILHGIYSTGLPGRRVHVMFIL